MRHRIGATDDERRTPVAAEGGGVTGARWAKKSAPKAPVAPCDQGTILNGGQARISAAASKRQDTRAHLGDAAPALNDRTRGRARVQIADFQGDRIVDVTTRTRQRSKLGRLPQAKGRIIDGSREVKRRMGKVENRAAWVEMITRVPMVI